MLLIQLSCAIVGFSNRVYDLIRIDRVTAKTTIRLWHELHVEKSGS